LVQTLSRRGWQYLESLAWRAFEVRYTPHLSMLSVWYPGNLWTKQWNCQEQESSFILLRRNNATAGNSELAAGFTEQKL
jgi:hypothetical protein